MVIVYGSLTLAYAFLLLPAIWLVVSSFTSGLLYAPRVVPNVEDLTLDHYRRMLADPRMQTYFFNSTVVATGATLLTLVIGSLGGYGLSRFDFPLRRGVFLFVISTLMLPWVLLLIPFVLIMHRFGLLDTRLGITLAHSAFALPVVIWLLKGYFDTIPTTIDDAARVDGCSHLHVLSRIILPLSVPGLAVAAFFTFTISWNDYLAASVIAQTDAPRTLPFGLHLYVQANVVDWGGALSMGVVMTLPLVVLFAIVQGTIMRGIASGDQQG